MFQRCALVALVTLLFVPCVVAQTPTLSKTLVASGFQRPVFATSPPGDLERLFIVEQGNSGGLQAQIRIIKNGAVLPVPFLNIDSLVINSGNERGLLGLAFHPDYASNGFFYVNYNNTGGSTVIRRYQVSANPDVANAGSGLTLMTIGQPFSNHNGGMLAFGLGGYLYIGMGDGGSGNDPGNRAQNINNLLGKMLRIDVDNPAPGLNYGIPAGNPYAGPTAGLDEIYHIGLRNPWRFSFDRLTHDLYIGDVGQNAREEISFQTGGTSGGINYGWRCMEANRCTGLSGCTCFSPVLTPPIHEYVQGGSTGWSITGGYVYRGTEICGFEGRYLFADYITNRVWSFLWDGLNATDLTEHTTQLGGGMAGIASFGEDGAGELYICSRDGGTVHKIVAGSGGGFPVTLTVLGTPTVGTSVSLVLLAAGEAFKSYVAGISAGSAPGTLLSDGRTIPLNLDPLLTYILGVPSNPVLNPNGNLSVLSQATVSLNVPNIPSLVGTTVYAGFVVLDPNASAGVSKILCPSVPITIQ